MIISFSEFLKENFLTPEQLDNLYKGNDNADMYNYDNVPKKPNKPIKQNTNTAIYTLDMLKSRRRMIDMYPDYYNFIDKIIKLMNINGWDKISVPNHIDKKLSKVNGISNLPELRRFRFLQGLKKASLKGIIKV